GSGELPERGHDRPRRRVVTGGAVEDAWSCVGIPAAQGLQLGCYVRGRPAWVGSDHLFATPALLGDELLRSLSLPRGAPGPARVFIPVAGTSQPLDANPTDPAAQRVTECQVRFRGDRLEDVVRPGFWAILAPRAQTVSTQVDSHDVVAASGKVRAKATPAARVGGDAVDEHRSPIATSPLSCVEPHPWGEFRPRSAPSATALPSGSPLLR